MHCDLRGQEKILNILETELKDQIYLIPTDFHKHKFYPSLESLKNKFIIKCKGKLLNKSSNAKDQSHTESDDDDEEEDNLTTQHKEETAKPDQALIEIIKKYGEGIVNTSSIKVNEEVQKQNENQKSASKPIQESLFKSNQDSLRGALQGGQSDQANKSKAPEKNELKPTTSTGTELAKSDGKNKKPKQQEKTLERLAAYYSLLGGKYNAKAVSTVWEMASISENKINHLYRSDPKAIIDYSKTHFVRIYPAGMRIDSSNYDPCRAWLAGGQMAALNFQTSGESMLLNYAKFAKNGNIGYTLKPTFMLSNTITHPELANYPHKMVNPQMNISITVISGQHLSNEGEISGGDIVDPYVEIKLRGTDADEALNTIYKTPVIEDNGFNPWWSQKEECIHHFKISAPEFATLIFKVFDKNMARDEKLGWYAIEVNDIQAGYRVIPVLDSKFKPIKHCYLFVHIKLTPYK